ncbi:unnamed protein product, partial [Urochloa humidicola]
PVLSLLLSSLFLPPEAKLSASCSRRSPLSLRCASFLLPKDSSTRELLLHAAVAVTPWPRRWGRRRCQSVRATTPTSRRWKCRGPHQDTIDDLAEPEHEEDEAAVAAAEVDAKMGTTTPSRADGASPPSSPRAPPSRRRAEAPGRGAAAALPRRRPRRRRRENRELAIRCLAVEPLRQGGTAPSRHSHSTAVSLPHHAANEPVGSSEDRRTRTTSTTSTTLKKKR